jgi:uncharacterized protein (TIGR03435 family)
MTKTAVTGVVVVAALLAAGVYAKPRIMPYFVSPVSSGIPPSTRADQQALRKLAASLPAGTVSIKPSTTSQISASQGMGEWTATHMNLQNAISNAFEQYGLASIIYEGVDPHSGAFDIVIKAPTGHPEQLTEMAQREIPKAYGVKTTPKERDMDVLVLRAPNGDRMLKPGTANGSSSVDGKAAKFTGVRMDGVTETIGANLGIPVIDETGLTGRYDITLKTDLHSRESVVKAVQEQLGLELTPDRRKMKVLVVQKAG